MLTQPVWLKAFGLAGSLVIFLAALIPGLAYSGKHGERYSILNHFISELGERGVSRGAWVFNYGLIVGGLLYLPFNLGLGLLLPGIWSKVGMLAGCVAAIAVALVGVYPMNFLAPHSRAATTYFRSGLVMVSFFSVAILSQPAGGAILPKELLWMGLLCAVCYAAFLVLLGRSANGSESPGETGYEPMDEPARPVFWLLPALEWSIFVSSILWIFVTSLSL